MSEKDLTIDSEIIDEITEGKEDKHVEKHGIRSTSRRLAAHKRWIKEG